jgi:hypothetical protein
MPADPLNGSETTRNRGLSDRRRPSWFWANHPPEGRLARDTESGSLPVQFATSRSSSYSGGQPVVVPVRSRAIAKPIVFTTTVALGRLQGDRPDRIASRDGAGVRNRTAEPS